MVIEKTTAFAARCPSCGRLSIDQVNIFQLSGEQSHDIFCECGARKASISRKGSKYIAINYYCIICAHNHEIVLPKEIFWSNTLNFLLCLNTDLSLGYFGSYQLIKRELDRQQEELNSMANELGFDDFADPEVMLEILDYLHDIAANGGLYCECGSHDIKIELYSDRLELSCNRCNGVVQIPASCERDLSKLRVKDEIVLSSNRTKSPNSKTQDKTYK